MRGIHWAIIANDKSAKKIERKKGKKEKKEKKEKEKRKRKKKKKKKERIPFLLEELGDIFEQNRVLALDS